MGPDRAPHQRTVELPAEVIPLDGSLSLAFRIATPRTPASMGWSSDLRPLGIRLTRAVIGGRGLLDLVARGWAALLGRSRTETSQSQPKDKDVSLSKSATATIGRFQTAASPTHQAKPLSEH